MAKNQMYSQLKMKKIKIQEEQYKSVFTKNESLKQRRDVADTKRETKELCRTLLKKAFKLGMKYKSVGLASFDKRKIILQKLDELYKKLDNI